MRDPHVQFMKYSLKTHPDVSFRAPPPIDGQQPEFDYRLADGTLTVSMKAHFPTETTAKAAVEPFLRAWELNDELNGGAKQYWFEFENASIIDLDPPGPGEAHIAALSGAIHVTATLNATLSLSRAAYPTVPTRLKFSPDVEVLWNRYLGYTRGEEPLPSVANAILTFIDGVSVGGQSRKAASTQFAIDFAILSQIGHWAACRGNALEARKLGKSATLNPLNHQERAWLERAIRAIIRRKAEYDADPSSPLKPIMMGDI